MRDSFFGISSGSLDLSTHSGGPQGTCGGLHSKWGCKTEICFYGHKR